MKPTDGPLEPEDDDDDEDEDVDSEVVEVGGVAALGGEGAACSDDDEPVALLLPRSRGSTGAGRPGRVGRAGGADMACGACVCDGVGDDDASARAGDGGIASACVCR